MSRLDRWTRHLLESEARKRGVSDPESLSRAELLRVIMQGEEGLRGGARKLVGSLLGGAALGFFGKAPPRPSLTHDTRPPPAAEKPRALALSYEGPSRISLLRKHTELQLSWQVSELAIGRARSVLGPRGELAVRVITVHADDTVKSRTDEHGPVAASGEWSLHLPSVDAHCVGSIGVRDGERFVSIAHDSSRASRSDAA